MARTLSWAALGLLLIAVAAFADEQVAEQKKDDVAEKEPESKFEEAAAIEDLENNRAAKLIAFHTTKTKAMFATTTSYAIFTCFSATSTPACTGRKKRNIMVNPDALDEDINTGLNSSLDDTYKDNAVEESDSSRKGKKFTFWNTVFSTYTLTSVEYYSGTTVTVSGLCSIAGLGNSCFG